MSWVPGQFEDVLIATVELTNAPLSVNQTFEVRNWEARCGLLFWTFMESPVEKTEQQILDRFEDARSEASEESFESAPPTPTVPPKAPMVPQPKPTPATVAKGSGVCPRRPCPSRGRSPGAS